MQGSDTGRYGVIGQTVSDTDVAYACESIRRLGYAVIDGGYDKDALASLSAAFERAGQRHHAAQGGGEHWRSLDEHNSTRLPLAYEPAFLELAANRTIL